ncbi:MAG TPA: S41 family peptidase, partial [Actinomycetota bacterium]|nr:S41 family peptidase [Actinomycetota bacterium]
GIEPGDLITSVDGEPVAGMTLDEVGQKIMGEAGTQVRIKVVRGAGDPREFILDRQKLEIPSVTSSMKDNVGILNLLSFTGGVGDKVRESVARMQREGARGFILDLRGNPGGSLDEAVQVASVFIEGGTVVTYRERGKPEVVYQARGPVETKLPLVVLADEGSASASEIVAGAIQDRQRGLIVGTETYKKGSVQRVIGLSDGSAIKLTVASYFTPSGRGIGENGVLPDVAVADRSAQLTKANEILSGMLVEAPGSTG